MSIVLARVDNRLVHGQILEAWVPHFAIDTILVIDRQLVDDRFHRTLLEGLGREDLQVCLVKPERAAQLLAGELAQHRVLALFSGIRQAVEALACGVSFSRLNLGNVHPKHGSRAITTSVNLTEQELRDLAALASRGVDLEARAVPADRSPDFAPLVRGERQR